MTWLHKYGADFFVKQTFTRDGRGWEWGKNPRLDIAAAREKASVPLVEGPRAVTATFQQQVAHLPSRCALLLPDSHPDIQLLSEHKLQL